MREPEGRRRRLQDNVKPLDSWGRRRVAPVDSRPDPPSVGTVCNDPEYPDWRIRPMLTWSLPSPPVHRARTGLLALALSLSTALDPWAAPAQMRAELDGIAPATIEDLNAAFDSGQLTSERLIEMYLARIEA